ncbi:MAG: hypothetical protein JKY66_08200 [Spongiibacteraceae bacterium]|nr:hypothetical protein [Spongiibacteraceae bacterium]
MKIKPRFKKLPLAIAISSAALVSNLAIADFDDSATDYSTDSQQIHVWNQALEPIELVHSILCFTGQMRANDFVNDGPYLVLADEGMCFKDNDGDDGSTGQSSGASNTPSYMEVIVNATRTDDSSPLEVSVWIPGMGVGEGGEEAIKFKAVIQEGASDTNPFGNFTFNYNFFSRIADTTATGGGEVKTINNLDDKIGFTLYDSSTHGDQQSTQSASVVMDSDRASGIALTSSSWGPYGSAFGLAFNNNNVLVQSADTYAELAYKNGDNSGSCLSRSDFNDAVWRYDLYDTTSGARVAVNSGFPFRYDSNNDGNDDSHGHAGYWGIWTEQEGALSLGDTINAEDSSGSLSEYTVVKAPGRLIKHTVESLTLSEARGIDFFYWDNSAIDAGHDQWVVRYMTIADDSTSTDGFYRVAGLRWSDNGPQQSEITPTAITVDSFETLHMHSDQLGGQVKFRQGDTSLTFFKEEFLNGSETANGELLADNGATTLHCFDRCPKGALSSARLQDHDGSNSPYEDTVSNVASAIQYSFSDSGANALTLVRNSNSEAVRFDSDLTQESLGNSPHSWGVRSGPMVTAGVAASLSNPWDIYDSSMVTEFYVWETGLNDWNQLSAVRDANGNIQSFDKPIQFTYRHNDTNDRSGDAGEHDNKVFMLSYGGNGDLWGIPQSNTGNNRWQPMFNIADGVVMGDDNQYVLKAREIEQSMASANGQCTGMVISDPAVAVPTSATGSADIGSMPQVSGAPSVIAGELQNNH